MHKTKIIEELLDAYGNDKAAVIEAISKYRSEPVPGASNASSNVSPVVISLKNVMKSYDLKGHHIEVLRGITLDICQGEFVAITGSSGSGKSTLLQLMGGLDKPTSGVIRIEGQNIADLNDKDLSHVRNTIIGFVFQFFYLQPFLKLSKNVEVPGMFAGIDHKKRQKMANELLEVVGLSDRGGHLPRQLSGGQLQRAAISRALINNPKIILADEPTGNLDSKNSEAIIDIFIKLQKIYNVTIVLVTHDDAIARRANRILTVKDGQLV